MINLQHYLNAPNLSHNLHVELEALKNFEDTDEFILKIVLKAGVCLVAISSLIAYAGPAYDAYRHESRIDEQCPPYSLSTHRIDHLTPNQYYNFYLIFSVVFLIRRAYYFFY